MKICSIHSITFISFLTLLIKDVTSRRQPYAPNSRHTKKQENRRSGMSFQDYQSKMKNPVPDMPQRRYDMQPEPRYPLQPDDYSPRRHIHAPYSNLMKPRMYSNMLPMQHDFHRPSLPYQPKHEALLYEHNMRQFQKRAFHKSPYPTFQDFEDQYPTHSMGQPSPQGTPYHSQRIRIKHSFPANKLNTQRISKLLPQFDQMDPRMVEYSKLQNTIVVEKKIPMPYKVKIEKPYFVEVTKHVAVPVPYPIRKTKYIPMYIKVPYEKSTDEYTGVIVTTRSPQYSDSQPETVKDVTVTPHSHTYSTPEPHHYSEAYASPEPQSEAPAYQYETHVSPSPTRYNENSGHLTFDELQQLMNSEKLPDDPFIMK